MDRRRTGTADLGHLIGLSWHHVLHARTCIERHDPWQAEYWISAVRDHTLALACHRLGHPASHAEGVHELPADVTEPAQDALVRSLEADELSRALQAAIQALLHELRATDPELADSLAPSLLHASTGRT